MSFDAIIGQSEIKTALVHAMENDRVGHAYIFSGPRGIGKRTLAGIFASMLLCSQPVEGHACGQCQACLLMSGGSNPDFRRVQAEGATIGVDEIREIHGGISIKPMYSKRKVYIIEDADKMTVQAQNALLKTLEEPPSYAVLLLTASNYEALLETIRSRSRRVPFRKNTLQEVKEALERKYGNSIDSTGFIASFSDGVIGTALELAGAGEFQTLREKTFELLARISRRRLYDVFEAYSFFEENKEDIGLLLDMMALYYRDLLVARETGNEKLLINSDKKDMILNNARNYPPQKLVGSIEQIEAARRAIKQNANYQLTVEHLLMKLQEELISW